MSKSNYYEVLLLSFVLHIVCFAKVSEDKLFPTNLPSRQWVEFKAGGYTKPVCGSIFHLDKTAVNGMALGSIDTGCIDLETNGLWGRCTIFNSHVPRRGPLNSPLLGLSIAGQTWVLCNPQKIGNPDADTVKVGLAGLTEVHLEGVKTASQIHYWGHYPVADLEYETDAPISIGMRVWAPFLPGNTKDSLMPAIVFEVHLRNTTDSKQEGTLATSFPGPLAKEAGNQFQRLHVHDSDLFDGVVVKSPLVSYALGTIGEEKVRLGGELGANSAVWAKIADTLPEESENYSDRYTLAAGASVAVDFMLKAKETKVVRFALTWCSPTWQGGGYNGSDQQDTTQLVWWPKEKHMFTHMYAAYYPDAESTAKLVAKQCNELLNRVIAWQQEIYSDKTLPGWLQDCLVNSLYIITENSLWAQAKPPIGSWCRHEDGVFAMSESHRVHPFMEPTVLSFYGNIPLVYFFPDANLSTLRAFKAYQNPTTGRPIFFFGFRCEIAEPEEIFMQSTMGSCLVMIIDRLLQRTDNNALLREFYESAKKATIYTMNLRPEYGIRQVISMPTDNAGTHWFDGPDWYGMVPHIGGLHLAQLQIMKRMAEKMADTEFAVQCDRWLTGGSKVLEDELWTDNHYLTCSEPETGRVSDSWCIFGPQLEGEWVSRFHGLPGVFIPERVQKTLNTMSRANANETVSPYGAMVFAKWDGTKAGKAVDYQTGYWGEGVHIPSTFMMGMHFMYAGNSEFGKNLIKRSMNNLFNRQGLTWAVPILCNIDTGCAMVSIDDTQNLMLWSVPAVINGQSLAGPCQPGGLVDRIITAASGVE